MTFLTVFSVIIILGVVIYAASNLYVLKSAEPYIMASEDASSLDADCILVLEDGKVVGQGTHRELLETCEVYQEIAKSQLSEEELSA